MNTPIIRSYRPADQPGIEWLYSRTPPWGRTYPRPEAVPSDVRNILTEFEHVLVAVEQDRAGEAVIGLTAIRSASWPGEVLPPATVSVEDTARLHHVLVAPERWRQGVGRRLTYAAIEWCRSAGYRAVLLETTTQVGAVHFYQALGFTEVATTDLGEWQLVWFLLQTTTTTDN